MFLYKITHLLCSLIIVSLCTLFLLRSVSYFSLSLFAVPLPLIVFAFIKKDKGQGDHYTMHQVDQVQVFFIFLKLRNYNLYNSDSMTLPKRIPVLNRNE